jgi:SAM-dependent methyltransferase
VTKRVAAVLALVLVVVPALFVLEEAVRTLGVLDQVERERDTWQRPDEIIRQLDLTPGNTVVDLGSGAGYFSLKIAPRVGPTGRVLAVDLRRESLAFLWIHPGFADSGVCASFVRRSTIRDCPRDRSMRC